MVDPPGPAGASVTSVRVRLVVVAVVALAAVGVVAASGLDESLVYYRTPSELGLEGRKSGERVRLGGMVARDSVRRRGARVAFVLTDGAADVPVVHEGDPPGVFQEGQGALVEGSFDGTGVFRSDLLLVKHDNTYRGPDGEEYEPPADGGRGAAPGASGTAR